MRDEGKRQIEIARDERPPVSESQVSRILKLKTLSTLEFKGYRNMVQSGQIIESAVLDLVDSGASAKQHTVLALAIRDCEARDAAKSARGAVRKGRKTSKGKVTKKEIRSAIKKVNAHTAKRAPQGTS